MSDCQLVNYTLVLPKNNRNLKIVSDNTKSINSIRKHRNTPSLDFSASTDQEIFYLNWSGFDGEKFCPSARITGLLDPDGTISSNCTPGKLQLQTSGEDGLMRTRLDIDKHGRVITYSQLWATSHMPAGSPLIVQSHYDETANGSSLIMRRSRGTYLDPASVKNGDGLFSLVWGAHTGIKYSNTASIEVNVCGELNKTVIPSEMVFKISSNNKVLIPTMSLSEKGVSVNTSFKLPIYDDELQRDSVITDPQPGMLIYIKDIDSFQGYRSSRGWSTLHN